MAGRVSWVCSITTFSRAFDVTVIPPSTFDSGTGFLTISVVTGHLVLDTDGDTGEVIVNGMRIGVAGSSVLSVLISGTPGPDDIDLGAISTAKLPALTAPIRVEAGDGDDTVSGSQLADFILVGSGDDVVFGNGGQNSILGEAGDDLLFGGADDDDIDGGDGADILLGMAGNDQLQGGDGNDDLLGAAGADVLSGGPGNDRLRGQGSSGDILTGGSGDDDMDGGSGVDRIVEDFSASSSILLTQTELNVDGNRNVLTGIERAALTGGDGGDQLHRAVGHQIRGRPQSLGELLVFAANIVARPTRAGNRGQRHHPVARQRFADGRQVLHADADDLQDFLLTDLVRVIGQPNPRLAVANCQLQLRDADSTRPHANRVERRNVRVDTKPIEDDFQRRFRRPKADLFGQVQTERDHSEAVGMMRQRQIAGQRDRPLAECFGLLLLLSQELLRLINLLFCASQLLVKLFVGRSELPGFLDLFLSPRPFRIATSEEIPGRFVPGRLVLSDRFGEKRS